MGKKSIIKWLAVLGIGVVAITSSNTLVTKADIYTTPQNTILASTSNEVVITNTKLDSALRTLLGKSATDKFKVDDFMTNDNYKPTTTDDGGVTTTTALNYQLDLSGTGVTDIIELVQFEFPSTLQGINLAENGITNDDLSSLATFLDCDTADTSVVVGDKTYTIKSDFSTIIKKINLNGNKLDLITTNTTYINNEKFLFGIQNVDNIHSSGFVINGEVKPSYYIRENVDESFLTFNFKYALSTSQDSKISIRYNQVTDLLDNLADIYSNNTDLISLEIKSVPDSSTAYFKGYTHNVEFTNFELSLRSDFKVERKSLLNLKVSSSGRIEADSPIILKGFGDNSTVVVSYDNASTSHVTDDKYKNYVNITLEKDGKRRTIPLEFIVNDSIKPIITLIGNSYAYSSQNKEYNDPGVIAYDPAAVGDTTGDDFTQSVVKTTDLDITKIGIYTITYTVSDIAGNTTSITRMVEIKERVLDRINLRVNTTEPKDGGDIVLSIQPDTGVEINNYTNIKYYWYINDELFEETTGDTTTGASTITIIGNAAANQQIYVKMEATQKADNAKIILFSDRIDLELDPIGSNDTLILAAAVAVLLIILTITTIALVKYSKGKSRTHSKHKNFKNGKKGTKNEDGAPGIQVIKDYTGVQGGSPGANGGNNGGTGGGNTNFRPPENGMDK